MESLNQLFSNKKFRVIMYTVFVVSLVVTFAFSTYVLLSNVETVNNRYHDQKLKYDQLRQNKSNNQFDESR